MEDVTVATEAVSKILVLEASHREEARVQATMGTR